jgi:hypothetical protein
MQVLARHHATCMDSVLDSLLPWQITAQKAKLEAANPLGGLAAADGVVSLGMVDQFPMRRMHFSAPDLAGKSIKEIPVGQGMMERQRQGPGRPDWAVERARRRRPEVTLGEELGDTRRLPVRACKLPTCFISRLRFPVSMLASAENAVGEIFEILSIGSQKGPLIGSQKGL